MLLYISTSEENIVLFIWLHLFNNYSYYLVLIDTSSICCWKYLSIDYFYFYFEVIFFIWDWE